MAVSSGENVSNITSSAVLASPSGELVANITSSAVLHMPPGEFVSNITSSAVLAFASFAPPSWDAGLTFETDAAVGFAYSQSGTWCSGMTPITYALNSGSLPPGLSLSSVGVTGTLSGTPTTAGTYTFTLKASNAQASNVVSQSFTITIKAAGGGSWAGVG